jgi:hypothetical protein
MGISLAPRADNPLRGYRLEGASGMSPGRIIRIAFYIVWGVVGGALLVADINVLFWHPAPLQATLETGLAEGLLVVPYLVWRYAGGRTQFIRARAARPVSRPIWRWSPIEISLALYFWFVRGRFVLTCAFALVTFTLFISRFVGASLHALR